MRFHRGVSKSVASKVRTTWTTGTAGTAGRRLFTRPSFEFSEPVIRHVSPRHARPLRTRPSRRVPHAISIAGGWSGGEEEASAELGAFEKPTGGSSSPSAKLQPLLELYFVACLMERTWRFCLPVVLAKAGGAVRYMATGEVHWAGYTAVAVLCFASPLAVLLFAPFIGQKLDASRRSGLFVWTLLLVQVMSIALSGLLLSVAFWTGTSIIGGWAFGVLLALQMVEKLSAVTSEVAIERDWITRICGKGNTAGLAHGNSMIRRFDLVCDFVGTVGVGVIIDRLGVGAAVWYCVLMSILSWPVINSRLRLLNIDGEGEAPKTDDKMRQVTMSAKERNTIRVYFFDNPMLFSSLVVVLLYFNVALSPGGILSAYLIHCDVTGTGLAMFRGACAIMGFLGSLVGKALINARGLMPAGRISLTFVVATLGISLLVRAESVVLFAALISASRMGIWAFDNVNAQLFQQGTRSSEQSGLAATEAALCSAAEIMMFGLVVGRGKEVAVEWFGWLGFLGWTMVVGGWIGFFGFSRKGQDTLQSTNKLSMPPSTATWTP